eukprot:m.221315 g.221315  ORF g.221315 m.221315 type:complete len:388 (+) comp15770_c0_seq1:29-1192(+)
MKAAIVLALAAVALATPFFKEDFSSGWESRWVQSKHKSDYGKFVASTGKYFGDAAEATGIKTSEDAKNYALSARFEKFSNKGKKLIVQFTVKHEQNIDCGGGYVKIFPSSADPKDVHGGEGETPYNIMFGPDICGPGHRKVHVIFAYKGKNLLTKKTIPCKADELTHLYTLIVNPDNTYEVKIDDEKVESGSLYDDFDFLPPKKINDPAQSKPKDWVDEKTIADAEDKKPEDWEQPETIADPEAKKPEDWDDDMDGSWEPPQIPNPAYKGEWKPRQIPNPAYKGEWVHPQIDNPEYFHDDSVYAYEDFGVIGFDLWQVKAGTIFDNVLITDSAEDQAAGAATFKKISEGEAAAKAAEEKKEAEKKAQEAADASADDDEDSETAKDEL